MTTLDRHGPGYRAAQMGRVTGALVVLAVVLLLAAGAALVVQGPGADAVVSTVLLPVDVELRRPGMAMVLAVAALVAATMVAIAGLQTASAMQVLSPGAARPNPLPVPARRARRWLIGPVAMRTRELDRDTELAVGFVPSAVELAAVTRLRCTVLVPAHDEEAVLGATLDSLADQVRPPDRVLVVADNCTDATVEVARGRGVDVVETVGNLDKKAGALNQQLARLLPTADVADVVLVMDADSTINSDFLDVALGLLESDEDLIAVGGLFYGDVGGGVVGAGPTQRVHPGSTDRGPQAEQGVRPDRHSLSDSAATRCRAVAEARGTLIPGTRGQVYDTLALTEDNELTFALKTLGARLTSPPECRVTTEVMTRWRDLWRQRLRWHRGALENLGAYGPTRATAMYWTQQTALAYGVVALWSYLLLMVITLLAADSIRWSLFWVTIGVVFFVERLVTVWAVGWRGRVACRPDLR